MEKFWKFIKGLILVLLFLGFVFLLSKKDYLTFLHNISPLIVPGISSLFLIYLVYHFIKLYLSKEKIEYEFTSIVNHTFRTPLTRINWITKELEKDHTENERKLHLQNLSNATNKLLEIVDLIVGIKNINDTTGYVFVATSIRDIVEKSITKYREEINKKNITFQVSAFKDIPLLTIDLKKIGFVIDNLVENAIFYTPRDGKILIDCILKSKNKILFYITDTGIGLGPYTKLRIFSKFYRSKKAILAYPDGMGLKLYLSKKIVKLHHGKIYAKSKGKNQGAVFFIELPINE
jgi:signal transduction histidine kinase